MYWETGSMLQVCAMGREGCMSEYGTDIIHYNVLSWLFDACIHVRVMSEYGTDDVLLLLCVET